MGEIILLGLLIGIIFYEFTDISPGGLVVPGMIAYYIYDPSRILMTLGVSILTFLLVNLVSNHMILYGKRRFTFHIIVSVILSLIFSLIGNNFNISFLAIPIVGYIVPGIISNEMSKQGMLKTLLALVFVSSIVGLLVFLI